MHQYTFYILFFTFLQNRENIRIKRIEAVFCVKNFVKNSPNVKNSFLHMIKPSYLNK